MCFLGSSRKSGFAYLVDIGWSIVACAALLQPQFLSAQATTSSQTPAPADSSTQTAPIPAEPVPVPVSPGTLPAVPAATPESPSAATPVPSSTTPPQQQSQPSGAGNALDQPIKVAPGPQAPTKVQIQEPVQAATLPSYAPYDLEPPKPVHDQLGSTYIPDDSEVYPMALRLYSMGFLNTAFIGMRPWTRRSLLHMLDASQPDIMDSGNDEAIAILARLKSWLQAEVPPAGKSRGTVYGVHSVYTRLMGIDGLTLRDSYHLGQTLVNDYGRPYAQGFNNITGFSSINESGPFSLYLRGEYQYSPSGPGYSLQMAEQVASLDETTLQLPTPLIPYPDRPAANDFRLQEAYLSVHLWGHEISGGKTDSWMGPAAGGAFAWSNNAQNIFALRINRVEPLHIPLLSDVVGPFRYDFQVGALQGHTFPRHPWVHSEMFSFRPTKNVEFGFERTTVWGGHTAGVDEPVTLHSFLHSFFDFGDTEDDPAVKGTPSDPGARFTEFNFSWRLPFLSHYVTLYTDSEAHDDPSPIAAPRRAAYRPGFYISHFPGAPKLDFRIEAASTDTSTLRSLYGTFNYFEGIQRQAYTNSGFIFGDWIGREAKGGQAWLTWHLSSDDFIQIEYLNKKNPKDFIPGGTTQNQFKIEVVKHLRPQLELDAWMQYEKWKAPVLQTLPGGNPLEVIGGPLYKPNAQNDTAIVAQFTWYPRLKRQTGLNGKWF